MITLGAIADALGPDAQATPASARDLAIGAVTADSRTAGPGSLFVAVPGVRADGMGFAAAACANGAVAIIGERAPDAPLQGAVFMQVRDARAALSVAAALQFPLQPKFIAAVTGTSGKTSVAAFTRQIWAHLGHQAAALGTTGIVKPSGATYGSLTTPDPVTLHRTLDELAREGVDHLAMEASSHGLDQRRLDGVRLAVAGFTNLSRDHLDYHATLDDYLAAKLRLFDTLLAPGQPAVLNADCDVADKVEAAIRARGLTLFSVGEKGRDITLLSSAAEPDANRIVLAHMGVEYKIRLPLAGEFMVSNALVAAGLCIASGSPAADVFAALESLAGAPGRLERIGERRGAPVFVDYAHKPDALEKVLAALRPLARRRLMVVFGCGGDRDAGKRAIMGEIAARLADLVIVTDDNPRSENPAAIRGAILAAAPGATEIGDRAQAIRHAVSLLDEGDVLVVAGKGHETGQIVGAKVLPFSDHDAVRAALQEFGA
ncbi:MAG: UDP-N-acetylmuramoyl-L-alanyl-D-glutamate--2,6-diaminopimelate ligase [Hyphomicrobiales bacterium]|nr:UDP-N-acetylmuramoyl-L-alanyl-D-glutamate--2,6-diaminopimelate ligase [Hyphomicrobiales bacterium]